MQSDKRKAAVLIGAGMVARTHVAACAASKSVRLAGIASRDAGRAMELVEDASRISGDAVKLYRDIAEVAADPEVDFAIVATPPNVRDDVIAPLAKAGKHILLEKPVARSLHEAQGIVSLCEDSGVALGVVFQHRMRAASLQAVAMVRSGALGQLGLAELVVPWWRDQSYYDEPGRGDYDRDGGGVLISQAIHTIDLGLSLTGPVSVVCAMAKTTMFHAMESEDYVVAGLEFANGAVGSLVASTASFPGAPEAITLHFERATLRLEAGQLHVNWRNGEHEIHGAQAGTGGGADPMAFTHEWHQAIIDDFVGALEECRQPAADGNSALAAHELIDAITKAAKDNAPKDLIS